MDCFRNTYAEINLKNITYNIRKIIDAYDKYKYYFGVVKADNYGCGSGETVKSVIDGGCNYLAVATLDEAISIRKNYDDVPILCLGVVPTEYVKTCIDNNITLTVSSLEYAKKLEKEIYENLKVHIKVNTGMNRLGVSNKDEIKEVYEILHKRNAYIEGIYTHIYDAESSTSYNKQIELFKEIISVIDISEIKIVHASASYAMQKYKKPEFINGCRIGISMYGFSGDDSLKLADTFKLVSQIIQINNLKKGDTVGYSGKYVATEEDEKIAVVAIGYDDGIIRKNTGRTVFINDKEYKIVGNICMDMLFVKVDEIVKLGDEVLILKDNAHIENVAKYLDTIPYEVMCEVSKRVPRRYVR